MNFETCPLVLNMIEEIVEVAHGGDDSQRAASKLDTMLSFLGTIFRSKEKHLAVIAFAFCLASCVLPLTSSFVRRQRKVIEFISKKSAKGLSATLSYRVVGRSLTVRCADLRMLAASIILVEQRRRAPACSTTGVFILV